MRKENGVWHFGDSRFEKWFLKYIWNYNFGIFLTNFLKSENHKEFPVFPKTLCSLFWGSLIALILTPIIAAITVFMICVISGCILAIWITDAFLGFYPDFSLNTPHCPYKHWGKKRIPIAIWEVCAILLPVYILWNYSGLVWKSAKIVAGYPSFIGWFCFFAGLAIYLFLFILFRTGTGKAFREFVVATKRKMCPLIIIDITNKKEG